MSEKEPLPDKLSNDRPKPRQIFLSDVEESVPETKEVTEATLLPPYIKPWKMGSLKIFLGAAAGVGKTYAMLEEGQELRAQGIDVTIGYVELHGRKDTERLLEGFEIIPVRKVSYRGTTLEEMDSEAIIARQPQLVLIDELAHTNAPGSEHEKRYEDIEEILLSGIDVYSTVNIQHLESLNDRVFELTGTRVRETFPDRILDLAKEVRLIDLPPEDLRDRIKQGKVYRPEKIQQALEHFFKTANLTVLRELALRETADSVESSAPRKEYREKYEESPPTANAFVLICVALKEKDVRVIRQGWRFAHRLNAPAEVITVWYSDYRSAEQEATIALLRRLARSLNLPFQELSGDPVELIVERARATRATLIVIGESSRKTWRERLFGSFTDKVLSKLDGVDIYVVGDPDRRLG
ncbi:MAG: universal stress protein [Chloroflexi bacterium]|uniref:Universal stress protein n=1 Tax=Candidatus Chlorohelix allophototropha TaxID=3003348 RepID=A0A8T7LXL4_9CHLR|nr:universal stress protein [Chloroflexota bacterium]WJW67490.1 universal stress protein [Chloroflexota bacterium L227-S17]